MSAYIIIFIIFWIGLTIGAPFYFRKRGVQEGQMLATGFGILGTFIGIVVGLIYFDVSNIDQSVPQLLDGLRFAFITSITGMGFSLLIGAFPKQLGFESVAVEEKDKSESELLAEVLEEIRILNKNVAGDNDTTLITQIQKMRTSIVDKQDELKSAFDEFAKQMAENNMKALVEAVDQVMRDFNAKINDQLGENFKRLSDGVEGLITWQDQYRVQIADATAALQESNKAIGVSVESLSTMTERAQEFDKTAQELKQALETMGSTMTGIKSLGETLQNSGQEIRDEMEKVTKHNIEVLGQNLASLSEKLVEDYSHLQRMMESATRNQS